MKLVPLETAGERWPGQVTRDLEASMELSGFNSWLTRCHHSSSPGKVTLTKRLFGQTTIIESVDVAGYHLRNKCNVAAPSGQP